MKIKHQLAIFNVITRLLLIVVLVLLLPFVVEKVVYKHINKTLLEKKQKFIEHLNDAEINDFINHGAKDDTYASFSILHDEFILLSKSGNGKTIQKSVFVNEPRIIEGQEDDYRILQYTFGYENEIYQLEVGSSLAEIKDLTFMIRIFTLVTLLTIVLLTFAMDSVYIEYLFAPFYRIIDKKIRRVNNLESFDFTTINSHSAEFGELDAVLNEMMSRIDMLFRQEKEFIANVSHELLSPISLLKNRFENMLQIENLNNETIDKIADSLRTLDLLRKIIHNLLLISKIDNNQFSETEDIPLKELLSEIIEASEDRLEIKEINLSANLNHDFVFLGNRTLIRILLFNLLSNAIKYNDEKGTVTISDEMNADYYCLIIADSGIGMAAAELSQIFNRFKRVSADNEGQGLGLAIVDSIAHFHHIDIKVTSELEKGSVFRVCFPFTKV
ncbi:sensor histidine kinase [Flavobacterium sp. 3HN19-14]|uniref:sensor histidine kinase n=1 Tax=Flavobacterium sp. 3HN19-14 TaxID=3448133 RepID=UPI003EE2ECC4